MNSFTESELSMSAGLKKFVIVIELRCRECQSNHRGLKFITSVPISRDLVDVLLFTSSTIYFLRRYWTEVMNFSALG